MPFFPVEDSAPSSGGYFEPVGGETNPGFESVQFGGTSSPESIPGSFVRSVATTAVPAVAAGLAGVKAGAAVTLATAPFIGPWAPIAGVAGGLLAAIGVGLGVRKLQDIGVESVVGETKFRQMAEQEASNRETHPYATFLGEVTPTLAYMGFSAKNVKDAWKFGQKILDPKNKALVRGLIAEPEGQKQLGNLINVAAGAGTETGQELYRQVQEGDFNPVRLAMALMIGAFQNEPTKLGIKLRFSPTGKLDQKALDVEIEALRSKYGLERPVEPPKVPPGSPEARETPLEPITEPTISPEPPPGSPPEPIVAPRAQEAPISTPPPSGEAKAPAVTPKPVTEPPQGDTSAVTPKESTPGLPSEKPAEDASFFETDLPPPEPAELPNWVRPRFKKRENVPYVGIETPIPLSSEPPTPKREILATARRMKGDDGPGQLVSKNPKKKYATHLPDYGEKWENGFRYKDVDGKTKFTSDRTLAMEIAKEAEQVDYDAPGELHSKMLRKGEGKNGVKRQPSVETEEEIRADPIKAAVLDLGGLKFDGSKEMLRVSRRYYREDGASPTNRAQDLKSMGPASDPYSLIPDDWTGFELLTYLEGKKPLKTKSEGAWWKERKEEDALRRAEEAKNIGAWAIEKFAEGDDFKIEGKVYVVTKKLETGIVVFGGGGESEIYIPYSRGEALVIDKGSWNRPKEDAAIARAQDGETDLPPAAVPEGGKTVYTTQAFIDAQREELGWSKLDKAGQTTMQALIDKANADMTADPRIGPRLVADLLADPTKNITALERVMLTREYQENQSLLRSADARVKAATTDAGRTQAAREADMASQRIEEIHLVGFRAGSEWGRAGRAAQFGVRQDFSIENMRAQVRNAANEGKPLYPEQAADVQKVSESIAREQGNVDAERGPDVIDRRSDLALLEERLDDFDLDADMAGAEGKTPREVMADRVEKRLAKLEKDREALRSELATGARRETKPKEPPIQKTQEIYRIEEEIKALTETRDAYLPKSEEAYKPEKAESKKEDALNTEISALNDQINAKEQKATKPTPEDTAEIVKLKAIRKAKRTLLKAMFPKAPAPMDQRIAMAEGRAAVRLAKLEKALESAKKGVFDSKKPADTLTSERLVELKEEIAETRAEIEELRKIAKPEIAEAEKATRLAKRAEAINKRADKLQAKIDAGDYGPAVPRPKEELSPAGKAAQERLDALKKKWLENVQKMRRDPEKWSKTLRDWLKQRGSSKTDAELTKVDAELKTAAKIVDPKNRDDAIITVLTKAAEGLSPKGEDWFLRYVYTNMLSGPQAHQRNIFGNTLVAFILRPLALIGKGDFSGLKLYMNKAIDNLVSGKAMAAAREAYRKDDVGKYLDVVGLKSSNSVLDAIVMDAGPTNPRLRTLWKALGAIPKFLTAQDSFFASIIEAGEMNRLIGGKLATPEEAMKIAKNLSEYFLYRRKLGSDPDKSAPFVVRALDVIANTIDDLRQSESKLVSWPVQMLMRFVRTPFRIAQLSVSTSPIAYFGKRMTLENIAEGRYKKPLKDLTADERIDVQEDMKVRQGLAAAGTAITLAGALSAFSGGTTWGPPRDPEAKKRFYSSGRRPYSFKVGDTWVPMMYLGPAFIAFALPAAARDAFYDNPEMADEPWLTKLGSAAMGIPKIILSQTPMSGFQGLLEALQGRMDKNIATTLGFQVTQLVPGSGMLRWMNKMVDPTYRKPVTIAETIEAGIPGLSKYVQAYKDQNNVDAKRPWTDVWLPYTLGEENINEEQRLQTRNLQIRVRAEESRFKVQMKEVQRKHPGMTDKTAGLILQHRQKQEAIKASMGRPRVAVAPTDPAALAEIKQTQIPGR